MEKPQKRLYRSRQDRMIGGVAAGIGEYFDIDPTLVRIAVVLLALFTNGAGVVAYIACMVVVPENPDQEKAATTSAVEGVAEDIRAKISDRTNPDRPNYIMGLVLLGVGAFFLMREFMPWFRPDWGALWPLAAIGVGLVIILKRD